MPTWNVISILLLIIASAPAKASSFLWGVSNSAFQVEGAPADSDWLRWTRLPGKIRDGSTADRATDFWNRYEEDFRLAQEAGLNAFRLSIAWERLEPTDGHWDEVALSHYEKMVKRLRDHGLEPVVTLYHFVLPAWLAERGGLLAPDFPRRFQQYAARVVARLSKAPASVKYWMTFNEPMILVRGSYLQGDWPPGRQDPDAAMRAAAAIAKAHLLAVGAIRSLALPETKVSIAKNWQVFEPAHSGALAYGISKLLDYLFNGQMMSALMTGKIAFWMPGAKRVHGERLALPSGRPSLDYLGINNYGRWIVDFQPKPPYYTAVEGPGPKSDMGWELHADSLYRAIVAASKYGLPILVSENGLADAQDNLRPQFLHDHVARVDRARREGYPVFGYLYWSLTDNFEWSHGLTPRFGLVKIDYKTGERRPRRSYYEYKRLVAERKP